MIRAYCIHETNRWDGPTEGLLYCPGSSTFESDVYYFSVKELGYVKNAAEVEENPDIEEVWEERTFYVYHLINIEKEYLFRSVAKWNMMGPSKQFYDEHKPLCEKFHERIRRKDPVATLKASEIEWDCCDNYRDSWKKNPTEELKKFI